MFFSFPPTEEPPLFSLFLSGPLILNFSLYVAMYTVAKDANSFHFDSLLFLSKTSLTRLSYNHYQSLYQRVPMQRDPNGVINLSLKHRLNNSNHFLYVSFDFWTYLEQFA